MMQDVIIMMRATCKVSDDRGLAAGSDVSSAMSVTFAWTQLSRTTAVAEGSGLQEKKWTLLPTLHGGWRRVRRGAGSARQRAGPAGRLREGGTHIEMAV
jgi:hypothetical protein